jgi:hypothetical protein
MDKTSQSDFSQGNMYIIRQRKPIKGWWKSMIRKIREKLKNREGSSVIEFAIGLMLFVLLTAFLVDMLMIGSKRYLIARETTEVSRLIGIQGGVSSAVPTGYPGGDRAYLTSLELYKQINERMEQSKIQNDEWKATLSEYNKSGQKIREIELTPTTSFQVDYMNSMDIKIGASYHWNLMSIITGGALDVAEVGAVRHTVSEFKYNFDEWEGEQY